MTRINGKVKKKDATASALSFPALKDEVCRASDQMVQFGSIIDSIDMIVSGGETSDFMMSFPLVRTIWDMKQQTIALTAENEKLQAFWEQSRRTERVRFTLNYKSANTIEEEEG